jgi:hypothetical protein
MRKRLQRPRTSGFSKHPQQMLTAGDGGRCYVWIEHESLPESIPGRRIIGTTQGQGVYRRGRLYKGAFATTQRDAPTQTISGYQQTRTPRKSLARAIPRSNHPSAGFSLFLQRGGMCQVCITISLDDNLLKSVQVRLFRTLCDIKCVKKLFRR